MSELVLRNGRRPRGPGTHNVTRDECETLIKRAVEDRTVTICEFYLAQVPDYVAKMLASFMEAQGLTIKPPAPVEGDPGDVQ